MYIWTISQYVLFIPIVVSGYAYWQQGEGAFVDKLGEELWNLSLLVTKYAEITAKYRSLNARVDTNDGRNLTGQIAENLLRMLERRTLAIKCLQEKAEELVSESNQDDFINPEFLLEYFSMQYSGVSRSDLRWKVDNSTQYLNLTLRKDRHFYGIPVNVEHSAVHVPTNLYDRYPYVAEAIQWTEGLTKVFVDNFRSDPDIGWQYFGTSSGMMRQFPAMQWHDEERADMYDCRTRPWFIEAATCAKDVVILMDSSGSMAGMRSTIAKLVVNNLLATLSNNDMIIVLNYSLTATPVIKCMDNLVPANVQNIKDLHEAVSRIKPAGNASVPTAFATAFQYLEEARHQNRCESECSCQQIIMLITDGLPGNITDVFEEYNKNRCVRVFTYLLGMEVQGVREMQQMACDNRGYYVHMTALDQVRDKVLKYLTVLSRPQALNLEDHPVRWTHLFADIEDPKVTLWLQDAMEGEEQQQRLSQHLRYHKSDYFSQDREDKHYILIKVFGEEERYQEYRLMTSAAIPVYDARDWLTNETLRWDLLSGVVGTDVPISELFRLTYPYKIGANGYAFIITNNGYLLMHPDHRPVQDGYLKDNYNSVDLLDVEFAADEEGEEKLQELRGRMLDPGEGDIQSVMVKFHYDDMRRVGVERRDYYFAPLLGTPFSLGLAIPADYGDYQIGVKDMINERFLKPTTDPLKTFFRDPEWRVHPDWMYCRYRYSSYKEFSTKEEELLDIMGKIKNQAEWKRYLEEWTADSSDTCYRPSVPEDAFICDPELLILLIFDASVTNDSFREPVIPKNQYETKVFHTYNATLRFVTTQSGLTRWQKIPKPTGDEDRGDFGEVFPRAIDEPWFKAAVLQYNLDAEGEQNKSGDSFVFSVPFQPSSPDELEITAAIAIFPRDGGRKAPASVLGYRITYSSFYSHFLNLSMQYKVNCESEDRKCYLLDQNAYVVLSESIENVGMPFVLIEPTAMALLLEKFVYQEIDITDYQGLVIETTYETSSGILSIDRPLRWMVAFLSWIWTHVAVGLMQHIGLAYAQLDDELDEPEDYDERLTPKIPSLPPQSEGRIVRNITVETTSPVFVKHTFYLFNHTARMFKRDDGDQLRLMSARRIQHTNLVLVVVDGLQPDFESIPLLKINEESTPCDRFERGANVTRRLLANCTVFHPKELEMNACGNGVILIPSLFIIVTLFVFHLFLK